RLLRGLGAASDERAGGLPADDEREVDVASERRRKLQRLFVASDAGDQVFDLVRLVAGPRYDVLPERTAVEENEAAGARAEELQRAPCRLAERADAVRGREEVDA